MELSKDQIHEIATRFLKAIPDVKVSPAKGGFSGNVEVPNLEEAEAVAAGLVKSPWDPYNPYKTKKPKPPTPSLLIYQTKVQAPVTDWEFLEPQFKLHTGVDAPAIYVHSKLKKNYYPLLPGMAQKEYGVGFILNLKEEDFDLLANTLKKLKKKQSHAGTSSIYYEISKLKFLPTVKDAMGFYSVKQIVEVTLETAEEWLTWEMSLYQS